MSWTVNGVTYHNYQQYQTAKANQEAVARQRRAETMAREVERLKGQIRQRETQLAGVSQDLERQTQEVQGMRRDLSSLRRVQAEAEQARRQMEEQHARDMSVLRVDQALTAEAIADLERIQERHMTETRHAFDTLSQAVEEGLAEAERRRQEGERRLQENIEQVEEQVRMEREARLAKLENELARATELVNTLEAGLARHADRICTLKLQESERAITERLTEARGLIDRGDGEAALAAAHAAAADVRTFETMVLWRQAELDAGRNYVSESISYLLSLADDKPTARYFASELTRVFAILERLGQRSEKGYAQYERLAVEQVRDEEILDDVRADILGMVQTAPIFKDMARDRKEATARVVQRLVELNGPAVSIEQALSDPTDLKSPMVTTCRFGQSTVLITSDLDGTVTLDGFGYESNSSCTEQGHAMMQALGLDGAAVGESRYDSVNRSEPNTVIAAKGQDWRRFASSIARTEGKL
ncbi:hypothetical protein [Rhodospirillum sp. A1_3_36]|uniref:hypothetical protein n=1 Tax=Rhodospirillum sp. A1_3_36 TaxID=3391666 RepID=UPI0039A57EC6